MSLLNKIERVERMHRMIRFKRTGSPQQFANKLGVSQSMLYALLKELKELGAPIAYCRYRESYEYMYPVEFRVGFENPSLSQQELQGTYGGAIIRPMYYSVIA